MTRAVSSNLKVKKSRKIIEDSDRESITSISDSEKSDYEEDECFTSSESEGEETPPPQKEKVKKEIFIRKMKDDKCFEFNIPLAIASRVISAIEIMTNERNNFQKK